MPTFEELAEQYVQYFINNGYSASSAKFVADKINHLVYEKTQAPLSHQDKLLIVQRMRGRLPNIIQKEVNNMHSIALIDYVLSLLGDD